ncbi:MAG: prepilin-type N-terminal cleavage/methylation domain-containing protein [Leptospirales bacterium]|nr:prepilin-type N-terminal cleavage/methylation domain-containing protein [Leptospirales bacterium]
MYRVKGHAGFTLIEITVASAIASIIMVMLYTSYSTIIKNIRSAGSHSKFYADVNSAFSRIDKDISNMYIDADRKAVFQGDNDKTGGSATFVTISRRDYNIFGNINKTHPSSDINEVTYFLKSVSESGDLFSLMRAEKRGFDDSPFLNSSLILENVIDLKFEFALRNDWTQRWDSKDTRRYPPAIKTTLRVKNHKGTEETFVFISCPNMI